MSDGSDLSACTAVILVGGLGTRLRSVVSDRPKVLAEINGRPFLGYLLDQVAEAGLRHVVLCTGYRADQVRSLLGDRWQDLTLTYSQETTPLGTGGALRLALPQLRSSTILALNGDSYCGADLAAFWDFHRQKQTQATLLLTQVPDTQRFGRVQVDGGDRIVAFEEKGNTTGPGWINAGLYLVSQSHLANIPADRPISLEKDIFPQWIDQGLYGYRAKGKFIDIGTPETYRQAADFFEPAAP
ncbi:nucleotidyltransferase family protein [Nodosilinea nodulosa]|uniref:nucleotidyltransferase family protein n=1 Tax=Nodosilinea nodulosa TaxID=416001 RepID=UPI0002EBFCBC|nr:nucleotidyltransferase family protein [Nodosilinea nodulosa]